MPSVFYFTDTTGFGGAEQALLTLLTGLDRRRWPPALIYHPAPALEPLLAGARQLDVALWPVPRMPDGREGAARVPAFVRQLRARRPTVFHAHLTWPLACKFGLMSAILARVPAVVATEHSFVKFHLDASIYAQQRLLAAGLDRYLPVSHDLARCLRQTLHFPAHKIQVIHNGILVEPFNSLADATLRASLNGNSQRPIVLTAARLDAQKGHRFLLEAAKLVPEAQFVLAGDGPARASLEEQAQTLGLRDRVVFLGYRSDIPELLACCDLFVLPSLYEGLPLSVLEAMAAGKPVIASAVGGTDEAVIPGETGLLVPPADPLALATAICTLLGDPPLARQLALNGRARVQREFSAKRMVQEVTRVYDELLSRREASHDHH
jgi:glycosyltransferase involved in cell wall biosynthesis